MKPMLANIYTGNIIFPVYCQPKLDGIRCIGGYSRTGKQFTTIGHIQYKDYYDGELIAGDFLTTCSLVKRKNTIEDCLKIKYYVYDLAIKGKTFTERYNMLQQLEGVDVVETKIINSNEELEKYYNDKLNEGYEGIIIRNPNGLYIEGRTNNLLKYKPKQDGEYEILDIIEGKGKLKGHAGYIKCEGFKATVGGIYSYRKELLQNKDKYIGQLATIEYQELSKYGIPRFPVFKGLRNYE